MGDLENLTNQLIDAQAERDKHRTDLALARAEIFAAREMLRDRAKEEEAAPALISRCSFSDEDRADWEERLRRSFLVARDAGYFLQCRECETGFELSDDLGPTHQLRRALYHAREHAERSR